MANLNGTWKIVLTDPDIGLHDVNDPPASRFRIDEKENTLVEINRVDWGAPSAWTLIPVENDPQHADFTKKVAILLEDDPHWAYLRLDGNTKDREIVIQVDPMGIVIGNPTGTARGRT